MKRIIALAITAVALMPSPALLAQERFRPFGIPFGEVLTEDLAKAIGYNASKGLVRSPPVPNAHFYEYELTMAARDASFVCSIHAFSNKSGQLPRSSVDTLVEKYGVPEYFPANPDALAPVDSYEFPVQEINVAMFEGRTTSSLAYTSKHELCLPKEGPDPSAGL